MLSKIGPVGGLLVDEVAQATEPSCIVPIVARGCSRLVLVGDHCQLPPSIQSQEAEARGLSLSLFGRLIREGVQPHFLDTQFRAHPALMAFPAQVIYGGKLLSGTSAEARPAVAGFDWPQPTVPLAFIEVKGSDEIEGESKLNRAEAARLISLLDEILAAGELDATQIGVVTPYVSQVRLLRQLWRERCKQSCSAGGKKGGGRGNGDGSALEIASVDNFQGREKELILFSAVRANRQGRVGFLADWRRLNVLLTRARRGLIVLGCSATLKSDPLWQQWLEFVDEQRVRIDRTRWVSLVYRAVQGCPSMQLKERLASLTKLDYAPLAPAEFTRYVRRQLDSSLSDASAQAMYSAVSAAARGWFGVRLELHAAFRKGLRWDGPKGVQAEERQQLLRHMQWRHDITHRPGVPLAALHDDEEAARAAKAGPHDSTRVWDELKREIEHVLAPTSADYIEAASGWLREALTTGELSEKRGPPPRCASGRTASHRLCAEAIRSLRHRPEDLPARLSNPIDSAPTPLQLGYCRRDIAGSHDIDAATEARWVHDAVGSARTGWGQAESHTQARCYQEERASKSR